MSIQYIGSKISKPLSGIETTWMMNGFDIPEVPKSLNPSQGLKPAVDKSTGLSYGRSKISKPLSGIETL